MICNYTSDGITQTSSCMLDGNVKSASAPVLSELSSGQKAIYIDEIKGVGSVTEVLYILRGELVNPLLEKEMGAENIVTFRAANLEMTDINDDGIIEIPIASELPNAAESDEKLYYTNWCSFNGEKLSVKLITIVNTVDGYYLKLPSSLVGSIAVLKDTENHKRSVYLYDSTTNTVGELLFTIMAVETAKLESDYSSNNYTEIGTVQDVVFLAIASVKSQSMGITTDAIKEMFSIIGVQ